MSCFIAFHRMRLERDALRPSSLDGLRELCRRGKSRDWVEPHGWRFYPGGVKEWESEDEDWQIEVERELLAVAGNKYVRRFRAVKVDDSKTPITGLVKTQEQLDRWQLRHVRVTELVVILREIEEK